MKTIFIFGLFTFIMCGIGKLSTLKICNRCNKLKEVISSPIGYCYACTQIDVAEKFDKYLGDIL